MSSILNVLNALKNPGQEYLFKADAEIEEMEVLGDPVHFTDVAIEGTIVGTGETVGMRAAVSATVTTRCARCLEKVVRPISAEIDAEFTRQPDPEDPDQYVFETSSIDMTDAAKDALLLELPMRYFCKEDCKGLCPKCGINLNTGNCSCDQEDDIMNPFAALRSIVQNNKEV